jgi:hypothetical protein
MLRWPIAIESVASSGIVCEESRLLSVRHAFQLTDASETESCVSADADGISVVAAGDIQWTMPWSDVRRIVAFRTAGFVGDDLVLAIESLASERASSARHKKVGRHSLPLLPLQLAGAQPRESWALWVAFDADAEPISVFPRA